MSVLQLQQFETEPDQQLKQAILQTLAYIWNYFAPQGLF
jgi:hypothetical protein